MAGYDPSISYVPPPVAGTSDSNTIDVEAILKLISQALEQPPTMQPPAPPPQPGAFRQTLGSLGDAIAAMGAVRAGGQAPPIGGYRAGLENDRRIYNQQLRDYQDRIAETETSQRNMRNTLRGQAILQSQQQKSAERVAGIKATSKTNRPIKSDYTKDIGGTAHRMTRFFDPDTGNPIAVIDPTTGEPVYELDNGPAAYADVILPAIPGESPAIRVPRQGPAGPIGEGRIPPPAAPAAQAANTALNMRVLYKDALKSYGDYIKDSSKFQRSVTSAGRNLPLVGGAVEEFGLSYTDPEGVTVARKIDNLADILLRLRSGAQINEYEYQRLRALLPKLGENPQTAYANFQRFETELLTALRTSYQRAPAYFTPGLLNDLGLTMQDLAGPENRNAAPGTGPSGAAETPEQRRKRLLKEYDDAHQTKQP